MSKVNKYFGEAGFLFISTILVNAGNYAINLLLGRFLGPQEFAEANILATLVLVLSFTALGFQLTLAKYIAEFNADNGKDKMASFLSWMRKNGFIFSIIICFALCSFSRSIAGYLNLNSQTSLLILFIGIPFYIHMSISRGYFQGITSFRKLAFTYIAEMLGRLIFTVVLVYLVLQSGSSYASEAVAIGFFASFIFAFMVGLSAKKIKSVAVVQFDKKKILHFIAIVGFYEFSQILINNSDVVLVKHFFENMEAGLYASLALIGRVVFFATWTIVTMLFPIVIEKEKKGEKHSHLFWQSLAIVGGIGVAIVVVCFFFDEMIINILFGSAYISVSHLLWQYAVATTLFSCANVFVYYNMSLNKYIPVFISLCIGLLQIVCIYVLHESIEQVILVQIALMALLFTSLIGYQISLPTKQKVSYKTNSKIKIQSV